MPNIRWLLVLITRAHRFVFLSTDGRIGSSALWMRFLLLGHVGRRSGAKHYTPLLCVEDDAGWIIAGSNAGDERPPAWWLNLQEEPEAEVRFRRERFAVKARETSGAEYESMWARLRASYRFYDRYREQTQRKIPVVVLERTDRSPGG